MELAWLEDFLSLARTRSFSRSAEERHITQPAFSRRIRALERWVGSPLVDRTTYPTALTAEGRKFRRVAEDVLASLHQARDEFSDQHAMSQTAIRFSAPHTLCLTFLPKWLKQIQARIGHIVASIVADNLHECVLALVQGNIDFLLCFVHPEIPVLLDPIRFPFISLDDEKLVPVSAVATNGAPLYELPGTRTAPLPYLAYGVGSYLGRVVELTLEKKPERPWLQTCVRTAMAEALKAMALEQHGVAWLPEAAVREELLQRRLIRSGADEWDAELQIRLYRSADEKKPKVEELWAAARAMASEAHAQAKVADVHPLDRRRGAREAKR